MDIDDAYSLIGEYGPYQRYQFWSLGVLQVYQAFQMMQTVFVAAEPHFLCQHGDTQIALQCHTKDKHCDAFIFPGKDFTSIVSEWRLVCGDTYKGSLVQSLYMAGQLIANPIWGYLADKYGRRKLTYVTVLLSFISACGAALAPSYLFHASFRFLVGAFNSGFGMCSYVLATELLGASKRSYISMMFSIVFAIAIAVFAALAYVIRDWRVLSLISSLPGLIGIYYYWTLPESPRWLYSTGCVQEAETLLVSIARLNKVPKETLPNVKLVLPREDPQNPTDVAKVPATICLTHPKLRWLTCVFFLSWFVLSLAYIGMTLSVGNLGHNLYINLALSGLVEIPAYVITLHLIERWGRRITYTWGLFLTSFACLIMMVFPEVSVTSGVYRVALGLTGKLAISSAFAVAMVYVMEVYPTVVRNNGTAIIGTGGRIAGVMAPLMVPLGKIYPSLDYIIYGALSFLAALLSLSLPETKGRHLPETLEDLDREDNVKQGLHS